MWRGIYITSPRRSRITHDKREDPLATFFPPCRKRIAPEIRCHVTCGRFTTAIPNTSPLYCAPIHLRRLPHSYATWRTIYLDHIIVKNHHPYIVPSLEDVFHVTCGNSLWIGRRGRLYDQLIYSSYNHGCNDKYLSRASVHYVEYVLGAESESWFPGGTRWGEGGAGWVRRAPRYGVYLWSDTSSLTSRRADNPRLRQTPCVASHLIAARAIHHV